MASRLLRFVPFLMLPLISGCESLFFGALNTGHGDAAVATRSYAPERDLKLDIYRPATPSAGNPVALFFYGGSWREGSRGDYAFVGKALANEGILVLVVDYRLYPRAVFPDFEVDAASAVRWAKDHVGEFGGNAQRIFLVGHSAGAQIVALLATDARYLAGVALVPRDLAGVVGIAGPYDFLPLTDPKLMQVFGPQAQWPASQPINFVDGDEPPFLLLQGLGDRIVAPRNSEAMQKKLESEHIAATYLRYPNLGHFRILAAFRFPRLAPTLQDTAQFINTSAAHG